MRVEPPLTAPQRAYLDAFDRILRARTAKEGLSARLAMCATLELMLADVPPVEQPPRKYAPQIRHERCLPLRKAG